MQIDKLQCTLVQLYFLDCSVRIFEDFLTSCQSKETQIRQLCDEMCSVVRILCLRILKKDVVKERLGIQLVHVAVSQSDELSDDGITIGEPTRTVNIGRTYKQRAKEA